MQHVVDIATAAPPSFGLADELGRLDGDWHRHGRHQLLYASQGALELETEQGRWWLPPARAAWLRGGTAHRVVVRRSAALRTVYFHPTALRGPDVRCRVFQMGPLARHMVLEAMRWGPDHPPEHGVAGRFFPALAALAEEWMAHGVDLRLPHARSPELRRAVALTLERLGDAALTGPQVARAAGLSTRTMARRFQAELGLTWRQLVQRARLLEAMDRLAEPGVTVTEVCFAVGYRSLGSFSTAFTELVGETPRAFRGRLLGGAVGQR